MYYVAFSLLCMLRLFVNKQNINANRAIRFIVEAMDTFCRLCLLSEDLISDLLNNNHILEKVRLCLKFQLIDIDHIPNMFCVGCATKIEEIFNFYVTIQKNQIILESKYLKTENDVLLEKADITYENTEQQFTKQEILVTSKDILIKIENETDDFHTESEQDTENIILDDKINPIVKNESQKIIKIFECLTCFSKFETQRLLVKHYNGTHYREHNENLLNVGKEILVITKNDIEIYKCKLCQKEYHDKKNIITHIEKHDNERPFLCKICGRTYRTASDIARHGRVHRDTRMVCSFKCGYSTAYDGALKEHERRHGSEFKYSCQTCGKGFHVLTWYEQHQNIHTGKKPFSCQICGLKFHMDRYLKSHQNTVHLVSSQSKRFVCVHCNVSCDSKKSLISHLREHGIKTDYLCDICGKKLSNAEKLKFHKMTHSGLRPFSCSDCSKSFTNKSALRAHEKSHAGETHCCPTCGKRYLQKSTLNRHINFPVQTHPGCYKRLSDISDMPVLLVHSSCSPSGRICDGWAGLPFKNKAIRKTTISTTKNWRNKSK